MKNPIEFIEEIQRKPEHVRRSATIIIVAVLSAVIIVVWAANISIEPVNLSTASITPTEKKENINQPSPFRVLWDFTKETINTFR